jgi:hypothetical protein
MRSIASSLPQVSDLSDFFTPHFLNGSEVFFKTIKCYEKIIRQIVSTQKITYNHEQTSQQTLAKREGISFSKESLLLGFLLHQNLNRGRNRRKTILKILERVLWILSYCTKTL